MASVAEFAIPAEAFPLGRLFAEFPDVALELERVVPTNDALIPYVWVRGASPTEEERIETAASSHTDVKAITLVDEVDGEYLLRVVWIPEHEGVLRAITETDVTLISGTGFGDTWTIEVRSDTQEGISTFQQYCRDHDILAELTALHSLAARRSGAEFNLTDAQREALRLAYDRGYYQIPRESSLDELAAELGITGQSFGSRLQRGTHRLIGSTIATSPKYPPDSL